MNLHAKFTGVRARKQAAATPPLGPCFSEEIVERIEILEVHGTSISDAGPDYCEFRAFDARGNLVGTKRVQGY